MTVQQKSKLLLILLIVLSLITVTLGVTALINIQTTISTILVVIMVILLLIIWKLRGVYQINNMEHKYAILQNKKEASIKIGKEIVSAKWIETIIHKYDYQTHIKHENYHLLYRFEKEKGRKKAETLFIVVWIKDQSISFESINLAKDIASLEKNIYKTKKYKHRIILQFKNGRASGKELKEADKVFYFQQNRINFVLINCLFDQKNKSLYFLHSNQFYPTTYYKYGVDEIKKITL